MHRTCLLCNERMHRAYWGSHLSKRHQTTPQAYYDAWLKRPGDGVCVICSSPTAFESAYRETCSRRCGMRLREREMLLKYGVKNQFQREEVKQVSRDSYLRQLGVSNPSQSPAVKAKKEATCRRNHGVPNPSLSKDVRLRAEATNLCRFGVRQPMDNEALAAKAMANGGGRAKALWYTTKHGDRILVQGSYERHFVDWCEGHGLRVLNGPRIPYELHGKRRTYSIDFDVAGCLVEIKSTYYHRRYHAEVMAKAAAAIAHANACGKRFRLMVWDGIPTEVLLG